MEPLQPRCGGEMATGTTSAMLVVGCHHFYLFYVVGSHHFVFSPSFSVSFTFHQIKSQCLRPLLQNERDKSASSQTKEAPGEFCNNHERVDDNDIDCW